MTGDEVRVSWQLPKAPHLRDHAIGDVAVVSGVDLIAWLARETVARWPSCAVRRMGRVRFERALPIEPVGTRELVIAWRDEGTCTACIRSRAEVARGMVRTYEHASVEFGVPEAALPGPPSDLAPETIITARRVYESLVPFGPWFQNLQGDIELSSDGARANARVPAGAAPDALLGSPFLLDAALHLGCAWGQRYAGVVALPIGFERRTVLKALGDEARCVVVPQQATPRSLTLTVWLLDQGGAVCDVVEGLRMMPWHAAAPPPSFVPGSGRLGRNST